LQSSLVTRTTAVSGTSYVSSGGQTWSYTYNGTVATTSEEQLPYTVLKNTLYAVAYSSNGSAVGDRGHVYMTQEGGDPDAEFAVNVTNAFRAINAGGRLITGIVKDIEASRALDFLFSGEAAVQPYPASASPTRTTASLLGAVVDSQMRIVRFLPDSLLGYWLELGDVINSVDDKDVKSPEELISATANLGKKVKIGYLSLGEDKYNPSRAHGATSIEIWP